MRLRTFSPGCSFNIGWCLKTSISVDAVETSSCSKEFLSNESYRRLSEVFAVLGLLVAALQHLIVGI